MVSFESFVILSKMAWNKLSIKDQFWRAVIFEQIMLLIYCVVNLARQETDFVRKIKGHIPFRRSQCTFTTWAFSKSQTSDWRRISERMSGEESFFANLAFIPHILENNVRKIKGHIPFRRSQCTFTTWAFSKSQTSDWRRISERMSGEESFFANLAFIPHILEITEGPRLTRIFGTWKKLCYSKFALVGL